MKSMLPLVFAFAACALAPSVASAMPVGSTFDVKLDFGDYDGPVQQSVGTWKFEKSFPADSYNYGKDACRFRVAWTNDAYLSKTTNIFLDELKVVGMDDCDIAQKKFLNTAFLLAKGKANYGFDPTQQREEVGFAIIGESAHEGDDLYGVIEVDGVLYSLELESTYCPTP